MSAPVEQGTPQTHELHPETPNPEVQRIEERSRQGLSIPFQASTFLRPRVVSIFLFLVALLPRLPGLSRFLTTDESYFIFSAGSNVVSAFLSGDFRGTYWHYYPGVTLSWLEIAGMSSQYLFSALSTGSLTSFTDYIYGDVLSLLVATRLPFVILAAAAVPAIYLLVRQLLSESAALLGALFVAFDPFYLAHSRVVHGDAPVTVFMSLSALAFFVYAKHLMKDKGRRRNLYLVLSAIFGGLAALTKAPGQFMALFIVGMSVIYAGLELWPAGRSPSADAPHASRVIRRWLTVVIIWGFVSLAVFILLWPSMWVDPVGTMRRMWEETFGKVSAGHLVYFFGRPTLDPGPWFYFYVLPFRMTPVVLIGTALSLLLLVPKIGALAGVHKHTTDNTLTGGQRRLATLSLLWLFTLTLLLFGNLSPKKQDRYLLPLFPFFDLLAAVGWLGLFNLVRHLIHTGLHSRFRLLHRKLRLTPEAEHIGERNFGGTPLRFRSGQVPNPQSPTLRLRSGQVPNLQSRIPNLLLFILLLLHLYPVITFYPYYLTYFNPLMGGPGRAAQTTLMGWGEGMEQVAAYLNTRPNAANLYVASTPSQTLLPYFAGTGENFYTNDIAFRADYVVLYLAQMQRLAPSPEIVRYFEAQQPETTVTIHGVTYAKIYHGPKLILPGIPPEAIPINVGLGDVIRLAGYKIPNSQSQISNLQLTLYWHALAPLSVNYTVSVRARAADGRLLAQQDSWPVDGLLPTTQWRQGDYVADTRTLEISPVDVEQASYFEVVVYNPDTAEPLGSPITLPIRQ